MIARVFLTTNPSVYTSVHESIAYRWREKEMIQPHPLVQCPPIALVVPERPKRPLGLQFSQGVRPALSQQASICLAALRSNQCVVIERSRRIDVVNSRYDVVVTGQDNRHAGLHEFCAMLD